MSNIPLSELKRLSDAIKLRAFAPDLEVCFFTGSDSHGERLMVDYHSKMLSGRVDNLTWDQTNWFRITNGDNESVVNAKYKNLQPNQHYFYGEYWRPEYNWHYVEDIEFFVEMVDASNLRKGLCDLHFGPNTYDSIRDYKYAIAVSIREQETAKTEGYKLKKAEEFDAISKKIFRFLPVVLRDLNNSFKALFGLVDEALAPRYARVCRGVARAKDYDKKVKDAMLLTDKILRYIPEVAEFSERYEKAREIFIDTNGEIPSPNATRTWHRWVKERIIDTDPFFWDIIKRDVECGANRVYGSFKNPIAALYNRYPKLNQNALAKAIGVSQPYVNKVISEAKLQDRNTTNE